MSTVNTWRESARSFRVATWLGWQIESNWTEPFLFMIYAIARPVASALILVFMYLVIAQGGMDNPLFAAIYLGNALRIHVASVMIGISWTVTDDREHYGILKYIYAAPIQVYFYLLGRGVAKTLTATVAVSITLAFGMLVLRIPYDFLSMNHALFWTTFFLGLGALALMGILLAGVALITARHSGFIGEAVAGALYLFCGAVFPLDVLPQPLQYLGLGLPLTYWLEGLRRAVLGKGFSSLLAPISDEMILLILVGATLVLGLASLAFYRWCEHRAKERGLIDMQTMY
ncbi:MAG: ABC transporter permease [Candidatus Bipolaricaulota bacterium]|nr:ABC transporter permease [Candidatus Bipolaricaulota bacterium]